VVHGLPEGSISDVWLIDNLLGSGRSVMPEPGDKMVKLGEITTQSGVGRLDADFDRDTFANFRLDLVVVSKTGEHPATGGILFGMPSLFQRLYSNARNKEPGISVYGSSEPAVMQAGLGFSLTDSLSTETDAVRPRHLKRLIRKGEEIFFNETFEGNGRTCGTCHPSDNNFTIDPEFIATLPPDDPLFVAEFTDSLNSDLNGGLVFENPILMREAGLIVENLDGFDDLSNKFVMRGVPHTLGMRFSLNPGTQDGTTQPPFQRTGWSGDVAPGGGTLRDFATGAVTQHFTKTMSRTPGMDFRLPSERELDALEAFQLSLGRRKELNLAKMRFRDSDVTAGQELFLGDAKCNSCHFNGGANLIDTKENRNFNTGTENFPSPFAGLEQPMPRDGGFGRTPNGDSLGGFGNGTFNTPSIIEAGDTEPLFHNHISAKLEDAVAFYTSDEFNNSPSGQFLGGIDLNETEIFQVTAFVYVLNVLENIRVMNNLLFKAIRTFRREKANEVLTVAIAEADDAIESMQDAEVQEEVVELLQQAKGRIENAAQIRNKFARRIEIAKALVKLRRARRSLIGKNRRSSQKLTKAVTMPDEVLPSSFALFQNHPNPFNPETEIRFGLPEPNHVVIKVFNSLGQEVRTLADRPYEPGNHSVRWDGKDTNGTPVSSGVYLYQIEAGTFSQVKQMSLMR
ncbi:T9SS type A sorting domain-containing protein, partial [bacterium]|nr:T9SS type A sorting domain-containing protein [bacterium]